MHAEGGLELGFQGVDSEVADRPLALDGSIPDWLDGALIRNGPGRFAFGSQRVTHWFDGLAMLQRYGFDGEGIQYTNRFLRSSTYERAMRTGELTGQFATGGGYLRRLWSLLRGQDTDNCNVHVVQVDGELLALTEVPTYQAVDRQTLETLGQFGFTDELRGHLSMAHMVPDPHRGETVGLLTAFGRTSRYRLFRVPDGSRHREPIAVIEADKPAYIHSVAVAANQIVLTEHPFRIDPISFLTPGGDGFVDHVNWEPARGTRFHVVDRDGGRVVGTHRAPPAFVFHHVNAYETDAQADATHDRGLVVDLVDYPDASVVDGLQLEGLADWFRAGVDGRLRRFRLPIGKDASVAGETLHDGMELPRIARETRTQPHQVVYAQGSATSTGNHLVKVDVESGAATTWSESGLFVEEPVPVHPPDVPPDADEGVVLVTALNVPESRSELLVFDAAALDLRARAPLPHHLPFGFHGRYLDGFPSA